MRIPGKRSAMDDWESLSDDILSCRRCPRLNLWREETSEKRPRRYLSQTYHALPVPSFGDPEARILVLGLAPGAHGANRTGRMFTGDRSGDWLYGALHRAGLANQAVSESVNDGLRLHDVRITNVCRCVPPQNKPTIKEMANCASYLDRELDLLAPSLRVIVTLGGIAMKAAADALERRGATIPRPRPKFGHLKTIELGAAWPILITSYHPSQQNTFTSKLTQPMFDAVWREAIRLTTD